MVWPQIDTLLGGRSLTVVDAGARNGFALLPQLHTYIDMYAVEPDAQSVDKLRKQYTSAPFRNTAVFDIALSDKSGEAKFYQTNHPSMSSLLRSDAANMHRYTGRMKDSKSWINDLAVRSETEVITETLDYFAASKQISFIDFLKLDTQGSELNILHGAADLLRNKNIGVVYTEVMFVPMYEGQCCFTEIDLWMRHCGYVLADLRIYPEVAEYLDRSTSGRVYEKPHAGLGGDAIYIPLDKDSVRQPASTAILLAALGYFSLAEDILQAHSLLSATETETLFRNLSKQSFSAKFKHLLKRFTPPAFHYWYSRVAR